MSGGEKRTGGIEAIQWFGYKMNSEDSRSARAARHLFFKKSLQFAPIPPVVESTIGVKGACSISLMRCSYALCFFFFMSAVASTGCGCGVRWSKWVKNSDIKKHFFKVATPETISCNV